MKTKIIIVEGKQIGIVGLEDLFEKLGQAEKKPDESLKEYLLKRIKAHNYIPSGKEEAYASVFLKEYEKFCERKEGSTEKKTTGTWQGIPREEIPWYPTIREELCDGCKVCLEFCPFAVYQSDETNNKVKVVNPFNCQVGCSICAPKCKPKAIVFPPLSILEIFRKR